MIKTLIRAQVLYISNSQRELQEVSQTKMKSSLIHSMALSYISSGKTKLKVARWSRGSRDLKTSSKLTAKMWHLSITIKTEVWARSMPIINRSNFRKEDHLTAVLSKETRARMATWTFLRSCKRTGIMGCSNILRAIKISSRIWIACILTWGRRTHKEW